MDLFQAFLLGIVQGITEFFPVSSSAHLKFTRYLLNISDSQSWLYFDLACHFGTWIALLFFLRKEVISVLSDWRKMALFTIALCPLIPAYFLLRPLVSTISPGYFLIATAFLLFFAPKMQFFRPRKYANVLFIGVMQAFALLPGLSRSGSTISAAKICGWSWIDGARFSFLLAIPTILGGEMLESWKLISQSNAIPIMPCIIGFLTSLVVGLFAVRFVFKIYEQGKVKPLAWYCLGFGALLIAVFGG